MTKFFLALAALFALVFVSVAAGGCARSAATSGIALPGPAANMPAPEAAVPSGVAGPNPGSLTGAGDVAAANLEAGNLKIVAKEYLASHVGTAAFTSIDLVGSFVSSAAKAEYYFNATGLIGRVDSVGGGWTGIVFSLSQQRWTKGAPDNDHVNDEDVP